LVSGKTLVHIASEFCIFSAKLQLHLRAYPELWHAEASGHSRSSDWHVSKGMGKIITLRPLRPMDSDCFSCSIDILFQANNAK
jgi:hypothetical protein